METCTWQVKEGDWEDYYLSASWEGGLDLVEDWNLASYWTHESKTLTAQSFECAGHSVGQGDDGFFLCLQ
jgi:hypothetical protein